MPRLHGRDAKRHGFGDPEDFVRRFTRFPGAAGLSLRHTNSEDSVKSALSRVALALLAALTLAGIASAATAGPSVKITSPRSGSTVSLRRTPYLAIAGTAS